MAKVTYLGPGDVKEGELVYGGQVLKIGEAVDVPDAAAAGLKDNKFFKVEGLEESHDNRGTAAYRSATEVSSQHPVPKPGEPVRAQEEDPLEAAPKNKMPPATKRF